MSPPTPSDDARRRHPSVAPEASHSFAHPSEALFARLLTLYGHDWLYEPLEFPLAWHDDGTPSKGFRPDFYLVEERLFIELTVLDQRLVNKKNQKVRRFRHLYPEIPLLVVYQRDFTRLLRQHDLRGVDGRAA